MRYQIKQVALIVALFATMAACGASARQRALQASYTSLTVAQASFTAWNDLHEQQIVAHATTKEEGQKALADYRTKREKVILGFSVAWTALAAAQMYDQPGWLDKAIEAASQLYTLIKELQDG